MLRVIMKSTLERNNTVGNLHVMQNPLFAYLHAAKHEAAASLRLPV